MIDARKHHGQVSLVDSTTFGFAFRLPNVIIKVNNVKSDKRCPQLHQRRMSKTTNQQIWNSFHQCTVVKHILIEKTQSLTLVS